VTELIALHVSRCSLENKQKESRRRRYLREKASGPMQFLKRAITPPLACGANSLLDRWNWLAVRADRR
jgi:hypothetical protein